MILDDFGGHEGDWLDACSGLGNLSPKASSLVAQGGARGAPFLPRPCRLPGDGWPDLGLPPPPRNPGHGSQACEPKTAQTQTTLTATESLGGAFGVLQSSTKGESNVDSVELEASAVQSSGLGHPHYPQSMIRSKASGDSFQTLL